MSIPPPNYKQLYQAFFNHIYYYKGLIRKIADEDLHQLFDAVLVQVDTKCRAQEDLSQKNLQDITASADHHIRFIFKSAIFAQMPADDQEKCKLAFSSLKEDLKVFQEIVEHKADLENEGLDQYLKTNWGRKQLEQLAKVGDPWALQTLRALISKRDIDAIKFLFISYTFPLMAPLFVEFKDDPYILDRLNYFLTKGEAGVEMVYGYVETVLKNTDWKWGEQLLQENLKKDKAVAQILWNIFQIQQDMNHFVNRFVMDQLFAGTTLGIEFVACVLQESSPKQTLILEQFFNFAIEQKNLNLDLLFLSLITLSQPDHQLDQIVAEKIEKLERSRDEYPGCYKKILNSLKDKKQELEGCQKYDIEKHSLFFFVRLYQLYALRTYRLMDHVCQGKKLEQSTAQAVRDYFPKTAAVLVGFTEKSKYFPNALSSILKPHHIPISILCQDVKEVKIPLETGIQMLESNTPIGIWPQDYSFISQEEGRSIFNYPMWCDDYGNKLAALAEQRILKRYPKEFNELKITDVDFSNIGIVNQVQDQLYFLDYMLKLDPQVKNQKIQFTFNEGGNCLIGEDEHGPYALIGKDALAYNQIHLRRELAKLGLKKNEHGQWQLGASYDPLELNLTEEDMKPFFAIDLNIPTDRVIFIEQPEYHLDMAMCLLGGKKVMLNASQLVYKKIKAKVEIELERPGISEKFRRQLTSRLCNLDISLRKKMLLEDAAKKDLEKNGFTVIPFAGAYADIFQDHSALHKTNSFNYLSLTTPNDETILICLGSDPEQQNEFEQIFKEHSLKTIDHIYFLDPQQSKALLTKQGGLHCITKCLPHKL